MINFIRIIAILFLCSAFNNETYIGTYVGEKEFNQALHLFKLRKKVPLDQISEILGSPDFIPSYEKNYYYIYRVTTPKTFTMPKVVKQRIIKVSLDQEGLNATKLELIDGGFNTKVTLAKKITTDVTSEQNLIKSYFGNFFRFNTRQKLR